MDNEDESAGQADTTSSLEKIKKQLHSCGTGNVLLQGPLLKRSDIIRKWEWRWFALDVSTGKLEYWSHKGDKFSKGVIKFDAYSTATVSPKNMMKELRYGGCCFCIITSQKKEYFLCAETAEAAEAWVATLRAGISVLKAHKEASSLLSGNARIKLESVATVVAAANVTAQKAAEDLQRSMKAAALSSSDFFEKLSSAAAFFPSASFKTLIPGAALSPSASFKKSITAVEMDSSDMMRETLKVKDEELHQLVSDIKSRDLIIKELADRLSETADAAESAASSLQAIDKNCRETVSEVDHLRTQLLQAAKQIRDADARRASALKFEETALQEAHRCRLELGKLRERGVILEAAMVRVEEDIRRLKVVHESETAERLKPRLISMESAAQVETSSTDELSHDDNVSQAPDVSSEINETTDEAYLHGAILRDAQAPELEPAGSCENVASGLRMESDILSRNTSAECAFDPKEAMSCIEELVPDGAPSTDGSSTSPIGTDQHEREVSLCPNPPEMASNDDDKAVTSQRCISTECASTTTADDCKDVSPKAMVMACGNEGLDFISDGNNEIEEEVVIDEVNMVTTEGNELTTGLELSEGTVVKLEQQKREELLCFDVIILLQSLQAYFRLCCF